MAIYLYALGGGSFEFPSMPESVKVTSPTNYQTFQIIGKGAVEIPKGMRIRGVSFSGVFFGSQRVGESLMGNWTAPTECVSILEQWQAAGTVLELVADEAPINLDVTISSFSWEAVGGFGNLVFSIEFHRYLPLRLYTTKEIGLGGLTATRPEAEKKGVYTVKRGDNLWNIARKMYGGSGTDWTKIMEANAEEIEATAQKRGLKDSDNGHWIFPGQVLQIPDIEQ